MNPRAKALKIAILAAGFSTRLGRSKPLARVRGETLLARTLGVVAKLDHAEIFVVTPVRPAGFRSHVPRDVYLLPNSQRASGLASSVRLAVRRARNSPGVLLLPVDLARLHSRDLHRMVKRWQQMPGKIIANDGGGFAGTPLILPRRYFALADELEGDRGLRDLLSRVPPADLVRMPLSSARFDVDTPADLEAARRQWGCFGNSRKACTA